MTAGERQPLSSPAADPQTFTDEERIALVTAAVGVVQAYDSDNLQNIADAVDLLDSVLRGNREMGSSPAAEAETRCTDPLGDAITVLEHVEIVDASSRPDTEQAQQRVNLALSYLRMLPQRDPRTMAQIVADADLREAGGVSDSSEATT